MQAFWHVLNFIVNTYFACNDRRANGCLAAPACAAYRYKDGIGSTEGQRRDEATGPAALVLKQPHCNMTGFLSIAVENNNLY